MRYFVSEYQSSLDGWTLHFLLRRHPDIPNVLDDPAVKMIANSHKKSPAQILLRHLVQQDVAVIPGAKTNSQIAENINVSKVNYHLRPFVSNLFCIDL